MAEYRKRFPAGRRSIAQARSAVVRFAASWFGEARLTDIELAVGEALANAAEHGFRAGAEIELRCRCDGEALVVDIKDSGDGFIVRRRKEPRSGAPRGYGITIMRKLMDRVRYSEHGTRVRLTKFVDPVRSEAIRREKPA